MTTTWTKTEHRDPLRTEPVFRAGDRVVSRVRLENGVATIPMVAPADVLLAEDGRETGTRLVPFVFQPRVVERSFALFGLRLGDGDEMELWLWDAGMFYGAPRRAEYRLAVLRPGEVTRVIHNAKNDFAMASGRERTYGWNDFVFEPAVVLAVRIGDVAEERLVPSDRAKTVDLREDLL